MLIGGFYSVDGALLAKPPVKEAFTLRLDADAEQYTRKIYTNNGRTASVYALQHCTKKMAGKKVLLPDYLCLSVISAIEWAGLPYDFYRVTRNLEIDLADLESKLDDTVGMLYIIHYFSVPQPASITAQLRKLAAARGLLIMEDITQALFSTSPVPAAPRTIGFGDYVVASTRKWFPMTDGGLCAINRTMTSDDAPTLPSLANAYDESVYQELLISVMRPLYDADPALEKETYLRCEKRANASRYVNLTPREMTAASRHIFFHTNAEMLMARRMENFRCLYDRLQQIPEITLLSKDIAPDGTQVPFGLTLLAEDRDELYQHLVDHNIIPEIQWVLPTDYYTPGEDARYLSNHNLMLQCDQRYGIQEMQDVAEVIARYYQKHP